MKNLNECNAIMHSPQPGFGERYKNVRERNK